MISVEVSVSGVKVVREGGRIIHLPIGPAPKPAVVSAPVIPPPGEAA